MTEASTKQSNVATVLAQWAFRLHRRSIPSAVVTAARRAIVDTVGVMTAGRLHPATERTRAAFESMSGPCSLVNGGRASAQAAALINGTAAHAYDMDDTSYTGIMHTSAVILPALLAARDDTEADDETALTAFIAGSEIACTVADMATHAHYFRGWWSTSTFGIIGATAATSKIYNLSESETRNAIAMAAASAAGCRSIFGSDAKPFLVGHTARNAVDFAKAAKAGVTGPSGIFEAERGFFALLNEGRRVDKELDTLGERWRLIDPGLFLKLFPICSAGHAAVEQTAKLCAGSETSPDRIAGIECQVPDLVAFSLIYDDPRNPQEAQFSLSYAVACAVHHGAVRLADISETAIHDESIRTTMRKVTKITSPALSTEEMRARYPECAGITVRFRDGSSREGFCGEAYGMPGRPLSDADLQKKFLGCAAFAGIREKDAAAAYDAIFKVGVAGSSTFAGVLQRLWDQRAVERDHAPTLT